MQRAQIHRAFVGLCLIAALACLSISNSYTTKPSNQHVFMTQICQSEETQNISILDLKQKLQILPIRCFPGSEGLFPKKYDKLLLSLAEYAVLHCKTSNVRKLIWKCGLGDLCGGLVDRLRGIAFTLLLAVLSRRKLLLYWEMPNGEQIYLKPNAINWISESSDVVDMAVYSAMDSAGAELDTAVNAIGQNNLTKVALKTNLELEFINNKPQWLIDGLKQTGLDTLSNRD